MSHAVSDFLLPRRNFLSALAALGLAACGFKLRGDHSFAFKSLFIEFAVGSALFGEFKHKVEQANQLQLITDTKRLLDSDLILRVFNETRTKTVVASSTSGQVREFQLVFKAKMLVSNHKGRDLIPEVELQQTQQLSYNESSALAKEVDEAQLYRQMNADMVQQILTRLASIKELP